MGNQPGDSCDAVKFTDRPAHDHQGAWATTPATHMAQCITALPRRCNLPSNQCDGHMNAADFTSAYHCHHMLSHLLRLQLGRDAREPSAPQ